MYEYKGSIKSNVEDACRISKIIANNISQYFGNDELNYNLRLVITELVVNGVEHGNCSDNLKNVDVCAEIKNNKIIIRVRDQGSGMECIPEKQKIDFEKTCGRGLFIVKRLTDNLAIINNEIVAEIYV